LERANASMAPATPQGETSKMESESPEITEELKKLSLSQPSSTAVTPHTNKLSDEQYVTDKPNILPRPGKCLSAGVVCKHHGPKECCAAVQVLTKNPRIMAHGVEQLLHSWLDGVSTKPKPSIFDGRTTVTIECFIDTLVTMFQVLKVDHCLLMPVILYIKRLIQVKQMIVTWGNIHRLILASTLVSMKFHFDEQVDNSDFARMIGLQCADVNKLEVSFLAAIEYDLIASNDEYSELCFEIVSCVKA